MPDRAKDYYAETGEDCGMTLLEKAQGAAVKTKHKVSLMATDRQREAADLVVAVIHGEVGIGAAAVALEKPSSNCQASIYSLLREFVRLGMIEVRCVNSAKDEQLA